MLYIHFWSRSDIHQGLREKLLTGTVIGTIGIILMLTPWTLVPGIVFDTRSILLSVAGLFFGLIPTLLAMLITAAFRIYLGGGGVYMGVAVILASGGIGLYWHYYRSNWQRHGYLMELFLLGMATHMAMAMLMTLLPTETVWETLRRLLIPVLIIYPAGTVLLGLLMVGGTRNILTRRALREKEESYKRLYESMKDAYAMVDMSGRIIESNPAFREMLGYTQEELLQLTHRDITPERWHAMEDRRISLEVIPNGSSGAYEKELIRRDGSLLPVELRTFSLKDDEGQVRSFWAIVRDISGRKRAEKELVQAKEQAEENNRRKTVFLADMSHEIRNPLNTLMGFSEILSTENLDQETREKYRQIVELSGSKLLRIINDMVDLSRMESGQLEIHPSDGLLSRTVNASLESFRRSELLSVKPEVDLRLVFPPDLHDLMLHTDFVRVQQVLDNLISNALKNTREGSVEVRVRLGGIGKEAELVFEVEDTGVGIPPEQHEAIFERFHQVGPAGSRQGTGLGLSISKGLVELLGGRLWFESTPGQGSVFHFTIPAVSVSRTHLIQREKAPVHELLHGLKLFIAEDDLYSYIYLKELLSRLGGRVDHARNGIELMAMLEEGVPDLLFLDINMPGKSGLECLQEMQEKGIRTRVIAQTAYAMAEERERCLTAGCHGYIAKPIGREELYALISKVLQQSVDG